MSAPPPPPAGEAGIKAAAPSAAQKMLDNPALRMMGIPRLRAKLPGRNWLIFWSVLIGFSGTVYYDKRQKRIIQQKWCNAVSHLSAEPLATNALNRKITVFLAAPPGDSIRTSREHFQEYIKPILVAAGVDWEAIEGRKEGDVRAKLAERIRKKRRTNAGELLGEDDDLIEELRAGAGTETPDARGGDLVIGRHTWKEYIRGLHEGWLGPTREPVASVAAEIVVSNSEERSANDKSAEDGTVEDKPAVKEEPAKPRLTPPYILPKDYPQSAGTGVPAEFAMSTVVADPNLLGFLKTPIRLWRFLNRRHLADAQGREVVNLLLSTTPQMYARTDDWEQKELFDDEEPNWHKTARAPNPEGEENKERPWTEDMVIDDRIGSRMRKADAVTVDTNSRGHLLEWKGGADTMEKISWWQWLQWAFDVDYTVPKCKGWEDGLKDEKTSD